MPCDYVERSKGRRGQEGEPRRSCTVPYPGEPAQCFFSMDEDLREWEHCANYWAAWYWKGRRANKALRDRLRRLRQRIARDHLEWLVPQRVREYFREADRRKRERRGHDKRDRRDAAEGATGVDAGSAPATGGRCGPASGDGRGSGGGARARGGEA